MGVARHPLDGDSGFDADGREAEEVGGKNEELLNLGGRESHLIRSGGHGRGTAGCVLARKRAGAGVIGGNVLPTARLAGFLLRLLRSAAALATSA